MTRRRRSPDQARTEILDAATELLAEGGVACVTVRAVAARVGMTDAGVGHHFGGRDELLQELLRHGGRTLRAAVDEATSSWLDDAADLDALIGALAAVYAAGFAELALALHGAGWRDRGVGLLDPVVQALHARRRPVPEDDHDTRIAVAALHHALATDPAFGPAFRRSAGLTGRDAVDAAATQAWWTHALVATLGLSAPGGGAA